MTVYRFEISLSIWLYFWGVHGSWAECHFLFSLVYQLCLALWYKSNTRMLVTFGICFKQHFDTMYLVFYNPSPPRMFLSLDVLCENRIQHGANGPLYVTSSYSTWIFCRGVSGFATDCLCGVWCRGLTTCLLHVGPPFGNQFLLKQLGCRFDIMNNKSYFVLVFWHMQLCMSWYIRSFFGFTFLNMLYFLKYFCTNIFHRRSLHTFYWNNWYHFRRFHFTTGQHFLKYAWILTLKLRIVNVGYNLNSLNLKIYYIHIYIYINLYHHI